MTPSNYRAVKESCIFIFCHYLSMSRWVICVSVTIVGHDSPSKSLFKHSDFFQVNASSPMGHLAKSIEWGTRGKRLYLWSRLPTYSIDTAADIS